MQPILFSAKGWSNHCAAKMTARSGLNADCLRQPEPAQPTTGHQMDASSNQPEQPAKSRRGSRHHVVNNRTSVSRTGVEAKIQNLAADEWRPTYPATRRLDERVPFAAQLSGWDPDRVADADYPWSVP